MDSAGRPHSHTTILKWLVFAASCTVAWLNFALLFVFGTIFIHLLEKYGDNRAKTALVHSLFMGTATTSGLFSGLLVKRFGVSQVSFVGTVLVSTGFIVCFFAKTVLVPVIFIGIVSGIGVSFLFVSSTIVVGKLFTGKEQETALAFQTFCIGFGLVGYPYLLEGLVVKYGLNGTFLLIGGLFLNNVVVTILFYLYEHRNTCSAITHVKGEREKGNVSVSKTTTPKDGGSEIQHLTDNGIEVVNIISKKIPISKQLATFLHLPYILVVLATGLVAASTNGLVVVLLDLLTWKGLSIGTSINCLTSFSVGNTVSRLVPVVLSKVRPGTAPAFVLVISTLFGIAGQLILLFSSDVKLLVVASVFLGLSIGGVISGATLAVASFMHIDDFGSAFGLLLSVFGSLGLASGPLYGYIRDRLQSYEFAIILTAVLHGVGACLYLATACAPCQRRNAYREDSGSVTTTVISSPKSIE